MQKEESGVSFNEVCYYASIPLSAGQILGGALLVGTGPMGWGTAAGMFLVGSGVGGAYYTYNTEKSDFEFTKYCKKSLSSGLASGTTGVIKDIYGVGFHVGGIAGGALGGAVGGVANSVLEGRGLPSGIQIVNYMKVGACSAAIGQIFAYGELDFADNFIDTSSSVLARLLFLGLNTIVGGVAAEVTKMAVNLINGEPWTEGVVDSALIGAAIAGAIGCVQIDYDIGLALPPKGRYLSSLVRPQILSQVAQAESAQFRYEQDAYDKASAKYQKVLKELRDFLDGCDEKFGFELKDKDNITKKITKDEAATAMMRGEKVLCRKKGGIEKLYKYQYPHYLELQRAQTNLEEARQRVGVKIEEQLHSLYGKEQAAYAKANKQYQNAFKKCIEILSGSDEEFGFILEVEKGATKNLSKNEAATAMMYGKRILAREKAVNKNFIYSYPHPNYAEDLMQAYANLSTAMQRVGTAMVEQLLRSQYEKEYTAYEKANAEYQKGLKKCIEFVDGCDQAYGFKLENGKNLTKEEAATELMNRIRIVCRKNGENEKTYQWNNDDHLELQKAKINLAAAMQKAGIKMMEQLVPHLSAEEQAASEKGNKFVQPPSVQSPPATQNANNMTGEDVLVGAQKYLKEFGLRLEMIEKLDLPEPEKKFLILELYINKRAFFKFNGKGLFVNPMADLRRIINEIKHKEIEMSKGLDQIRQLAEQYHWNDILEAVKKCSVKEGSLIIKCNDVEYIRKKVPGDGDCGYTALGLTRNKAIELLKANVESDSGYHQAAYFRGAQFQSSIRQFFVRGF